MKQVKRSFRTNLVGAFVLVIALILAAQIGFNTFLAEDFYSDYKAGVMEDIFEDIKAHYSTQEDDIEALVADYEAEHNVMIIVQSGENVVYASFYKEWDKLGLPSRPEEDMKHGAGLAVDGYLENPVPSVGNSPADEMPNLRLRGSFDYEGESIQVSISLPMASIESGVTLFTRSSTMISLFALAVGLIVSAVLSKSITKPVREMEQTARRLAELDFSSHLDENVASCEMQGLAYSINSMSDQLETAIGELHHANEKLQSDIELQRQMEQIRQQFVANVSHEMKTPLALLQMYAANLKSNFANIDTEYYLDTIVEETDNLSDMVTSMLEISNIECGLAQMNMERISLSRLTEAVVAKTSLLLEDYQLEIQCEDHIMMDGDAKYLEQALKNILTNAKEHSAAGVRIAVALRKTDGGATLSIWNEGSCISDADMPRIWDSFYRSDKARVRENKNVGLGLHIVKLIVEKHGGQVWAENRDDGVMFALQFKTGETICGLDGVDC